VSSLARIGAIADKEVRQLSRDRITFGMVIMLPLIQLLLFGYAINPMVRDVPVGVVDMSGSAAGRAIVEQVAVTQVVDIIAGFHTPAEAEAAIAAGRIRAALVLPGNLTQRIAAGDTVGQWLVDGSDTNVGNALLSLREMPLFIDGIGGGQYHDEQTPTFEVALFFNPERRSAVNIVPGLAAIILTMTMILFTSIALVRESERGNMELLITTPIRPLELMIGKLLPYVIVGFIQLWIILGLGGWIFDVALQGSPLDLALITLAFVAANLTLGLLISTFAGNQMQAMQLTIFILLPSILLSGFMFPYDAMPRSVRYIAEILPATHFMRLIRGVYLRGADAAQLQADILWLAGFTAVMLTVATRRFHKTLD
tara:strand:- start:2430 stop:3536 length:1107 start_codon:yes stop_codon:yes gene_type:complete